MRDSCFFVESLDFWLFRCEFAIPSCSVLLFATLTKLRLDKKFDTFLQSLHSRSEGSPLPHSLLLMYCYLSSPLLENLRLEIVGEYLKLRVGGFAMLVFWHNKPWCFQSTPSPAALKRTPFISQSRKVLPVQSCPTGNLISILTQKRFKNFYTVQAASCVQTGFASNSLLLKYFGFHPLQVSKITAGFESGFALVFDQSLWGQPAAQSPLFPFLPVVPHEIFWCVLPIKRISVSVVFFNDVLLTNNDWV